MKLRKSEDCESSKAEDHHAARLTGRGRKVGNGKARAVAVMALELAQETADAADRAFSDAQAAVGLASATAAANGPAFRASEEALLIAHEAFARARETMSLAHECALMAREAWALTSADEEKSGRSVGSEYKKRVFAFSVPVSFRKWAWLSATAALLGVLSLSVVFGYAKFRARQLEELVKVAEQALTKGEYAQASLSARRALQMDDNCQAACEVMAKLCEQVGDARAVEWRQKAAELSPNSLASSLAFASAALRFDQVELARQALTEVSDIDRGHPDFLATSGALALATKDRESAERFYAEASRLAQGNASYRFALAKIRASSDDFFSREMGRKGLSDLADDPEFGAGALRALIASYQTTGETLAAQRESARLTASRGTVFADKLLRLTFLITTGASSFSKELSQFQNEAARNPRDAAALVLWMVDAGRADEALEWINRRAPEVGKFPEVQPTVVACHIALGHWGTVERLTESEWIEGDYIRHAYRARAMREQGHLKVSQSEWESALISASRVPGAINWLKNLATAWRWDIEEEQALWMAVEKEPKSKRALGDLARRFHAKGDTAALRRVATSLLEADRGSADAQNDYAFLSLLLLEDLERAFRLARDLHLQYPENAAYASTYALALHLQGHSEEALGVMLKLSPEQLEQPSIAAYHAILLVANHEHGKAGHFLKLSEGAPFLPQERQLIAEAANAVAILTAVRQAD